MIFSVLFKSSNELWPGHCIHKSRWATKQEKSRMSCHQMAQACNPSYLGVEIRRITVWGKKFTRPPHLNQWLSMVACACHPSYMGKHKEEDHCPGWPRHKASPYLNNSQCKKVQMVEPSKPKVLSSTFPPKKNILSPKPQGDLNWKVDILILA
jgi:hypothetical protein